MCNKNETVDKSRFCEDCLANWLEEQYQNSLTRFRLTVSTQKNEEPKEPEEWWENFDDTLTEKWPLI